MNRYRQFLYEESEKRKANAITGERARRGIVQEELEKVVKPKRAMTGPEVLHYQLRYLCDEAIQGSAKYVDEVFVRE